ncbi:MAG: hypothetical protein ACOCQR_00975 [bacterium]
MFKKIFFIFLLFFLFISFKTFSTEVIEFSSLSNESQPIFIEDNAIQEFSQKKEKIFYFTMALLNTKGALAEDLNLSNFPTDKERHFLAGSAIMSTAKFLELDDGFKYVFGIGVLKEVYDHSTGGTVELEDVIATCLGGLFFNFAF